MSDRPDAPAWQRAAAATSSAGDVGADALGAYGPVRPLSSIDWAQEIPTSLLRGTVAMTTLAVGQFALGEKDTHVVARRSFAGAMIGEVGIVLSRVAAVVGSRPATDEATLEGMLLYGETEAARYAALFAAARRRRESP